MNTEQSAKDGRLKLLEQLKANAQLTRMSRKTDAATAQFASQLEAEFDERIKAIQPHPELPLQEQAA